jgi:hypothetical protein
MRAFGKGEDPHKQFIAALFQQIFTDWQALSEDPEQSANLLGALLHALQEKHIMIHMQDENLGDALNRLGWSGSQQSSVTGDYLMFADANRGNKSNRSMTRQITYDVDIQQDGSILGRASIEYDYPDRVAANDRAVNPEFNGPLDYNNLLQVFVPPKTTLLETSETIPYVPDIVHTDTHTIFVLEVRVPYDTTERFQFI